MDEHDEPRHRALTIPVETGPGQSDNSGDPSAPEVSQDPEWTP